MARWADVLAIFRESYTTSLKSTVLKFVFGFPFLFCRSLRWALSLRLVLVIGMRMGDGIMGSRKRVQSTYGPTTMYV
jgi:hypothetical protein